MLSEHIETKSAKKRLPTFSSEPVLSEAFRNIETILERAELSTRIEIVRLTGFIQFVIWTLPDHVCDLEQFLTHLVFAELGSPTIWSQRKDGTVIGDILDFPGQILIYPV